MHFGGFDPEILQDFLTECGELLDELEGDLVALEGAADDLELVNKVFRALHTIKGSASFLAMTNLVSIAHAAETALNAARNGDVVVDAGMMDLLLAAVDTVKRQFEQIRGGAEIEAPDAGLVERLTAIGEGRAPTTAAAAPPAPAAEGPRGARSSRLDLGPGKADLLEFLIADVDDTLGRIGEQLGRLGDAEARAGAAGELGELGEALARSVEFFEFASMARLVGVLGEAAHGLADLQPEGLGQLLPRLRAVHHLLLEQARGLHEGCVWEWPIDGLVGHVEGVLREGGVDLLLDAALDPEGVLTAEGVFAGAAAARTATPESAPVVPASVQIEATPAAAARPAPEPTPAADREGGDATRGAARKGNAAAAEQTIRVEVSRLEALMNLVGELVLQKNRVGALSRRLSMSGIDTEQREQITTAASELDRVTGDIQLAVMRTRMQPLEKLFGKYPRLIRDLAQKTGKRIELRIEGAETEVDKSVIEELGDPLVHVLRNSADHGVEPPEARRAAGKPEAGTITLRAANEGGVVRVVIEDDGKGLSRERIGSKAVARGLVSEQELAQLSDRDVMRFIFAAGFSTAEQVSDLSGRGVGMDVVRTNIEKLKGTVDVDSEPGQWTRITFTIPLTVAIMPAMMVDVSGEIYALPLGSIVEIVRPSGQDLSTIGTGPVMRLRDEVLPLVDAADAFSVPAHRRRGSPFAVVLSLNDRSIGLMVSRLIGQQEIVIKPLEVGDRRGPFSGTTVRDDGGVSLIVDVGELMKRSTARGLSPCAA